MIEVIRQTKEAVTGVIQTLGGLENRAEAAVEIVNIIRHQVLPAGKKLAEALRDLQAEIDKFEGEGQ